MNLGESHTWKLGWIALSVYLLLLSPLAGALCLAVGGYLTWRLSP